MDTKTATALRRSGWHRATGMQAPTLGTGAGALVALSGLVVLAGWAFDIEAMKRIVPGGVGMKANSALAFVLCGMALSMLGRPSRTSPPLGVAFLALMVMLIAGLSLAEELFARDFGIDELLFADPGGGSRIARPGRMSPATAYAFTTIALALALAALPSRAPLQLPLAAALSGAVAVIAAMGLAGHFSHRVLGWQWGAAITMSLHAALTFLVLGLATLRIARRLQSQRWALGNAGTAGFLVGIALMLGAAELAAGFARDMANSTEQVVHSQQYLQLLQEIRTDMRTLEGAQRGHLIRGDESFLVTRETLKVSVRKHLSQLRAPPFDAAASEAAVGRLQTAIDDRIAFGDQMVTVRRLQGFEAARSLFNTEEDVALTTAITQAIAPMAQREREQLQLRRQHLTNVTATTFLLLPIGSFLGLTVLLSGLFFLDHGFAWRRRAEQALKRSRTELQVLFDSMSEGVHVVDQDRNIVKMNRAGASIHGLIEPAATLDSISGQIEVLNADGSAKAPEDWPSTRALHGEFVRDCEMTVRRRDGSQTRIIEINTAPLPAEPGRPARIVITSRDVTERKSFERQLQQLNVELEKRVTLRTDELQAKTRELESFCYSVSHDLKAPLRGIDGYSRLLLDDYADVLDADGRKFLDNVRRAAAQMNTLIEDLLAYSRQERRIPVRMRVELQGFLNDKLARRALDLAGVDLTVETNDVAVWADPESLAIAVRNLLDNAVKFSARSQPPAISISTRVESDRCILTIRDNGTGFDMRYYDKIFEIFQRLHRSEDYPGTGVGLALVRKAIERMGGRVWAQSQPGAGASFHLSLELAGDEKIKAD